METIDTVKAARVWQRVQGQQPDPREGLQELIAREWEVACACLQLSRRLGGQLNVLLRQLHDQPKEGCPIPNRTDIYLQGVFQNHIRVG